MDLAIGIGADENASLDSSPLQNPQAPAQNRVIRYFGDYELLEEIARGGMGVVYQARQISLNRPVALKMILAGQLATPALLQRFHTEAEAAARLDHPHIVPIYEIGEYEGQHYFSMKLIEGGTLAARIAEQSLTRPADTLSHPMGEGRGEGPFDICHSAFVISLVARAVHYAHQRGILHRDLKPGNILIDRSGVPHVTDFGLAKLMETEPDLTKSVAVLGTPSYMAPEQAAGHSKTLTTAADIYSLGAILYELLAGQPPFVADTPLEIMRKAVEEEPVPPSVICKRRCDEPRFSKAQIANRKSEIDRDLETICLKCLSKDPQKRYGSAQMLAEDLDRWRNGEPILARPIGAAAKVWRWCKRRPVIAGLLLALHVVFAAGLAGILWQWRRAQGHADAATDKLREAYIAQARANRRTDRAGRRYESLAVIEKAAALNPSAEQREELRNEAIACFALTDLRVTKQWPIPIGGVEGRWRFDSRLKLYAQIIEPGGISICQVEDNHEVARLPAIGAAVNYISSFSPDARFLTVRYGNRTNCIWDIARRDIVFRTREGSLWTFTPDSRFLIVSHVSGALSVRATDTWKEIRRVTLRAQLRRLRCHPNGTKVAGVPPEEDRVEVVDITTGKTTDTWATPGKLSCLTISANGSAVAAGSEDGQIYVWNMSTGERRLKIDAHQGLVSVVEFNRAGTLLASLSYDNSFRLWDALTGYLIISGAGKGFEIQFAEDDLYVAHAEARNISLFEMAPPPAFRLLRRDDREMGGGRLAFSPDGRILAATAEHQIRFSELATGKALAVALDEQIHSVHFHPDGKSLITSTPRLYRWPIDQEDESTNVLRLGPRTPLTTEGGLSASDLSPDGRFLVAAQPSKAAALVFDLQNLSAPAVLRPHPNVSRVVISPDGRFVATGTWGGSGVKVWDVASCQLLKDLPAASHAMPVFSPDGRWLATSAEEHRLYKVGSWELRFKVALPNGLPLNHVAFSPDGEIWAVGNHPRNTYLYATATGQRLAILEPPLPAAFADLRFSADGTILAVLQHDRAIQLWDLRSLRYELAKLNLDWEQPAYPPAVSQTAPKPIRMEIINSVTSKRGEVHEFPSRDPSAGSQQIDLTAHYNAALDETWWGGQHENSLANLPLGLQTFGGVKFDVRGLVQLSGNAPLKTLYPTRVGHIAIERACRSLHFLHATHNAASPGQVIGNYVIHYTNGGDTTVPIVYHHTLRDWWVHGNEPPAPPGLLEAWTGTNAEAAAYNTSIRLFRWTWENPLPEVEIRSLDFVSDKTPCAPFLVAITAE